MYGCDKSLGIYFVYILDANNIKQKNKKPWNNTKPIFPEQKKEVFCFTSSVSSTRSFDWNLEPINIWTNCLFGHCQGIVHLTVSLGIQKTMPLATMSQQAHACWELKYWSPSTWLVCGHFIQIHSWMSICFSCMYTNNYTHFHKWFPITQVIQS